MIQITCGTVVLANGTTAGGIVEELEINGTRLIEKSQPLRAGWITVFDRGNRENQVSFTISTQQASRIAALNSVLTLNDTLPGVADFVLSFTENGVTFTATLAGAGWSSVKQKFSGITSIAQLGVVGGEFAVSTIGIGGGSSGIPFVLPTLTESQIDPLVIPANYTATVASGLLLVARSLQLDGSLIVNGDIALIG